MLLAFVAGLCGLCLIAAPEGVSAERRDSPKRTKEYGTEMAETTKTDSVIPRLFKYADQNVLKEEQYTSDVYVRHRIHTVRRGHIVRYLPHMFRLERGTNDYLTEASLRIQYRPPGEVDCKVKAFHTTGAYLRPMRLENMRRFSFQIYDTRLFTDRILNPLNRRNLRFYRYTTAYRSKLKSEMLLAHIVITPRFSNAQLVKHGEIDVDCSTGAVKRFRFELNYEMQHFVVTGTTGENAYDCVLPVKMRILSNFRLLGNRVDEVYDLQASYVFACPLELNRKENRSLDLTQECRVRIDTASIHTERSWFDSIRPFPLRSMEAAIYRQRDSLLRISENDRLALRMQKMTRDSLAECMKRGWASASFAAPDIKALMPRSHRMRDALLSSHQLRFDAESRTTVKFPALITPSMVAWSGSKGLSLQTRIRLLTEFPRFDGELSLTPSVGYSFKQKQIYWNVPFALRFWPQMDAALHLEAGGGQHMFSSRQADEAKNRLTGMENKDSLLMAFNNYDFQNYRDTHVKADVALSFTPVVRITLGTRFHYRSLLQWNKTAQEAGLYRSLCSWAPRIQMEWTPRQYYYRQGKRRVALYSHYPTFILSYERGFSLTHASTGYERLETDVRYRLPLYALRTLYFRAGGGLFTKRQKDCFLDYDYFRFNNMPERWDDEMTGEFQLLNARWYNESRHYVRFTSTYESPMLLFSRIPWVSKFVEMERVYANLLSVNMMKCYTEWGYGISTNLLDVGLFTSISAHQHIGWGMRFAFNF